MEAADEVVELDDQESRNGAFKMKERLQKRHKERLEDAERRKEAKENLSVASESVEYFLSTFNDQRSAIEELLCGCLDADQKAAARRLEEASSKTVQLQKFLNDSIMFLTTHDRRKAQVAIEKLQTSLNETREKVLPKKKFGFRGRTKASSATVEESAVAPPVDPGITQVDGDPAIAQCGFSNMSDMVLVKTAEEIQKEDVHLSHLSNCKVRLYGSPSTLHLKHIDRCEILCGPVATSVFVDFCESSTLVLACQQLRTHNTQDTCVYLHVTSRAIVEDCRGISFAPYSWSYPNLEEDLRVAGLDPERNNWDQVDDFNWLAAGTPSPNWTVIPEEDRKTTWDA
ncbi:tubulin-specific chaperone C [Corythoichthys intestinalis]|uniref:tubulin-specific chaperone C n=1 Tax=Corythoichthys intestinalis TaxID=161448 RepID=UPI0025A4DDA6|nr:tubulin-specific chaperone C [Corythoichthys intestinalis]XP_061807392.1 tubulin-specific chaperone C-like [Nerophis lumbriciformis]